MAGERTDFQYPIRAETNANLRPRWNTTYTYACNGCGKEVRGYAQSRVKGHIWCHDCYRNRQKKYRGKQRDKAVLDRIKSNLDIHEVDGILFYKVEDVLNLFKKERT